MERGGCGVFCLRITRFVEVNLLITGMKDLLDSPKNF